MEPVWRSLHCGAPALVPALGYEASSRVARRALAEKRSVAEIVLDEGLLTEVQLNELLQLEAMTRPHRAKVVEDSAGTALFLEYKGRKVADV